jgi:predicted enzyme related to lactoylglutathione lyase
MEENTGKFLWIDLTVSEADKVRDFYSAVVGWNWEPVAVGDYEDYNIMTPGGELVAGICYRKGLNINLPPAWINYVIVDSVMDSMKTCTDLGGHIVDGPRKQNEDLFVIIQDPAGAYIGLYGKE